jgi:RNA polymerase sigma-70 factor (ECF subfamily)
MHTTGEEKARIPATADTTQTLDPERWVEEHGDYLLNYAFSRLRNRTQAQDFVQETLLAALRSQTSYTGRAGERTWLTSILRHKIFDFFRSSSRERCFSDLEFYAAEERETFSNWEFPGHWTAESAPKEWAAAGAALDRSAFWAAFHECSGKLPTKVAQVFLLREIDEVESGEICETLGISQSNLWVMLHRARLALRRCLETHWFCRP